ncbi:MAG: LysR substrate-binding domain-containing protein [Acidobacteriaceae bacterium]
MDEIELRHLRYFVAVAEELHFGRAALRLHLAQPPLSQQIRKLEGMLGHALFYRTSREVRLTSAGEVFLQRARRTLSTVAEDVEEVRSVGRGEQGVLRVGFVGSGMLTSLPNVFRQYRRAFPKVQLMLHESFTSQVVQGLETGTLDVGFLRDGGRVEGLEVETLFSEPFVAVVPARHALAASKVIAPLQLRDEPFGFYAQSAGPMAFERPMSVFEGLGSRPKVVQEASHWLTILQLIGAGLGVSVAPACVQKIMSAEVVCRPLKGVRVRSEIELAYRTGEERAVVEAFAELARRAFRKSAVGAG